MTEPLVRPIESTMDRYRAAMSDARTLHWHPVTIDYDHCRVRCPIPIELGVTYIGAVLLNPEQVWALVRVQWCEHCGQFEVAQSASEDHSDHAPVPVTHIALDILGVPSLRSS